MFNENIKKIRKEKGLSQEYFVYPAALNNIIIIVIITMVIKIILIIFHMCRFLSVLSES